MLLFCKNQLHICCLAVCLLNCLLYNTVCVRTTQWHIFAHLLFVIISNVKQFNFNMVLDIMLFTFYNVRTFFIHNASFIFFYCCPFFLPHLTASTCCLTSLGIRVRTYLQFSLLPFLYLVDFCLLIFLNIFFFACSIFKQIAGEDKSHICFTSNE